MIKVIHLLPSLTTGGAETMVKDYCLLFDKNRIDVQVVVLEQRLGNNNETILSENGIKVTYLSELLYGDKHKLNVMERAIRKLSRYYYWRKLVLRERPDIIHLHLHLDGYMRVLPLKKLNCSLVMTIHNVIDNFFSKSPDDGDRYKEYKEVYRLIHRFGMQLIALHNDLENRLKEYFDTEDVVTINNGIRLDRFRPKDYNRRDIRTSLGVKADEYLIGNVGSFSTQKNHELILKVFKEISNKYDRTKLLLVGQGSLKEQIEEFVENNKLSDKVIILSNRGDIPELMCAMDVFFFPSRWEGFGNVMIEAQSMGLRCVISDGVPECTRVSERVAVCQLNSDIEIWERALMDIDYPTVPPKCNIEEYDMRRCVKSMESFYESILVVEV